MKIEQIATSKLIPYANNARTHSETQVAQIAGSIRQFGFNNPVLVDESDTIIAGHGRVLAARMLELDKVPCIRLTHLTESQRKGQSKLRSLVKRHQRREKRLLVSRMT